MFVFLEGETTLKLEAKAHGKLKHFNVDVRSSSYYDYPKMGNIRGELYKRVGQHAPYFWKSTLPVFYDNDAYHVCSYTNMK